MKRLYLKYKCKRCNQEFTRLYKGGELDIKKILNSLKDSVEVDKCRNNEIGIAELLGVDLLVYST